MRTFRLTLVGLLTTAAVTVTSPALARDGDGEGGQGDVKTDGHVVDVSYWDQKHDSKGDSTTPRSDTHRVVFEPKQRVEKVRVPTCDANEPENGADVLCMAAVSTCPEDHAIRYWVYTRTAYTDGREPTDWKRAGTECVGPNEQLDEEEPVITEQMVIDSAKQAAPKPQIHLEPAARSYVNIPTNAYSDTAAQTITVDLAGYQVPVTFRPTTFQWSFGDGGSGSGAGIVNARVGQAGAVEHQYRRSGSYSVTLTRGYAVSVVLPNGQRLTLDDPVTAVSAPHPLQVGEIQAVVTDVR